MGRVIFWIGLAVVAFLQILGMLRVAAVYRTVLRDLDVARPKMTLRKWQKLVVVSPLCAVFGGISLFNPASLESGMYFGLVRSLYETGTITEKQMLDCLRRKEGAAWLP